MRFRQNSPAQGVHFLLIDFRELRRRFVLRFEQTVSGAVLGDCMRSLRAILLIVPSLLGFTFLAQAQEQTQTEAQSAAQSRDDARLAIARTIMVEMADGKIGSVCKRFSVDLKDALPEDELALAWNQLVQKSGVFQKQISQSTHTAHGISVYVSRSQFENSKVELRLMFNDSDQVTRISIAPVSDLSAASMEESARAVAELLRQRNFDQVVSRFDDDMKADMSPFPLEMSWSHVISHLGEFKSVQMATKDPEFDVVDVTCEFENGAAIVRVSFDPYGKISGLWLLPSDAEPANNPEV
jgi:hypothetical protein